jgi:DNA-binding beta-propeller fold protein YncE
MKARLAWLCLPLVIGLAVAGCGSSNSSNVSVAISPSAATVLLGTSVQFIPSVSGSNNAITWSVNGVANGNATFGTISSTGLYTAPITRPVQASAVAVPVIFAMANAAVPGSGSPGSVIELQSGFDFTNFAPGNTINIAGNSVAGWNGSFLIVAVAALQNGNVGVQIANPAGPPANGLGGTATATPNITITAQVQSTSAIASAIITLDSGIRVAFTQPTCTIGTSETFLFTPLVAVSGTSNNTVTWSLTGVGSIDPNSGLYTAPATAGTATVTATSVADPTESASATLTIATAADPTLASISPPTGALGAAFQQVYLSGANFICTTAVFVNLNNAPTDIPLPTSSLSSLSSSTFLVSVPDSILSTQPTAAGMPVTLTFKVERQNGTPQVCSPSTACQLTLSPVRPAVVAATPDSVRLPASGTFNVTLDGGYSGTTNVTKDAKGNSVQGTPVVNVQFNGQSNGTFAFKSNGGSTVEDRELVLAVPASDAAAPGLYPITLTNTTSGSANGSMAAVNLAVQPSAAPTQIGSASTVGAVGTNPVPSSVAINTATGIAVVTNQGTHDISILSLGALASPSLSVVTASLCTGSLGSLSGSSSTPCSVKTGPTSVAVDNIRNLALVANNANATLAVINLSVPKVTALLTFPSADSNGNPLLLAPVAVGINPVSGHALVAFTAGTGGGSNAGAILDLTQSPPALINVVNLNNGPKPHIAVSPRLNWAIATPGGAGLLSIVDLGRQTTSTISSISCNSNIVTANTTATLGVPVGQPVLITGTTAATNGIFQVATVSNTSFTFADSCNSLPTLPASASYALPVATLATPTNVRGVSINDETQKALLVDPNGNVPAFVFNILDQTSPLVNALPSGIHNVATAMNPLTNIGVIVNDASNQAFVVDPVTPSVIPNTTFNTGSFPVDVAIDPAANTAVIVNQSDNTVSLFSLGGMLRSGPQIIQSSLAPVGTPACQATICSTLGSAATAPDQNVTLIGKFTSTSVPRLDGDPSPFQNVSRLPNGCGTAPNICRVLTAALSGATLAANGPRLYALDVLDSSTSPPTPSNAARLQAIQAVNLVTGTGTGPGNCGNPSPQGVAIDAAHNVAVVSEPGCNDVSMVNLAYKDPTRPLGIGTGFGAKPELAVGTNPQGVAVYAQAGLAVVANAASNNASIVDIVNDAVPQTIATDPIPSGVAIDLGTGKAVVTANGASVVDVFPVSTTAQTPTIIGVQLGPTGVAIDPRSHVAVVSNSSSNTASIVNLSSSTTANTSGGIFVPQGVAFDPISDSFLITSFATNQVIVLNPNTVSTPAIRVGIGPSSIAYNPESGTLVTANNLSGTMTVVDFIDQTVRGVFSLKSSTQFAVDIHPQTNLAVVADTVDNQLLLVPLPH